MPEAFFSNIPWAKRKAYKFFRLASGCGSIATDPWPTQETLDKFFGDIQPEIVHIPNPRARSAA